MFHLIMIMIIFIFIVIVIIGVSTPVTITVIVTIVPYSDVDKGYRRKRANDTFAKHIEYMM